MIWSEEKKGEYIGGFIFLIFAIIFLYAKQYWPAFFSICLILILLKLDDLKEFTVNLKNGQFTTSYYSRTIVPKKEEKREMADMEYKIKKREMADMEYKILNTLWTKQVIYYPNFSRLWGFRINAVAPEYMEFREATNQLIKEGYIIESDQGQYFLTKRGIKFCADNYKTFRNPEEQYWPKEKFTADNLKVAIEEAKNL